MNEPNDTTTSSTKLSYFSYVYENNSL